uniref:Melatonin receptor 1B n=1 Tax=Aotus nancymaae TaxID=37293 RepID=A0A2K5CCY7_AOTNA
MSENGSFANCREAGGWVTRPGWLGSGSVRPCGTPRPPRVAPALCAAVDVVGNRLVILSVLRNRELRTAGNLFLVSLALADLVVALYSYPLILMDIYDSWVVGEEHCKASAFVMGLSVVGSVFITAIAINRYCYICHSVAYHRIYRRWHTPLHTCLIWPLTVGSLEYDPRIYSCTFIQTACTRYPAAVVVIHFLLPVAVVSFCYLCIWMLVLQARRKAKPESRLCPRPSDLRSFLTMFAVFVILAFCWAQLNCISLAVAINPQEMAPQIPDGLFVTSYLLAYFNSCLNAIIYGLLNHNFRKEYKRILSGPWNPRHCIQNASKGSHAEGRQSPAAPITGVQHPAQAHAL